MAFSSRITEIVDYLCLNSAAIIANLDPESIQVYEFLQKEFQRSDISNNLVFQFVFRSYYRLDNAGLTKEFKTDYFKIMQEVRNEDGFNVEDVASRLYLHRNLKDQENLQFSFVTKLFNTIDNNQPIYDSEVAKVFHFNIQTQKTFDGKLKLLQKRLEIVAETYKTLIIEDLVSSVTDQFNSKFPNHQLSEMKKLDFIFWSAGKILTNRLTQSRKSSKGKTSIG